MHIKSTENKKLNLKWINNMIGYVPLDTFTFVFSLITGLLLGFLVMGVGSLTPIYITLITTLIIASLAAIDGGTASFIYVIRLAIYSVVITHVMVLYPSSKIEYKKQSIEVVMTNMTTQEGKRISITLYDTTTKKPIKTTYYPTNKRKLLETLYSNTKFVKYVVSYYPLIKYSKSLEYYND